MALLENFNLVYGSDMRVLDPSVELNALTGVGPQFHLEVFHTMRWVGAFEGTRTVFADHQSIAFRGQRTETMIPHLPIPPWPAGVPLLKTIVTDSKCHIYCHNSDVEIEGQSAGVAMLALAPPFHCASIQLPAALDGLGKALDQIPGVGKIKRALGGLSKLNAQMAKLDAAGQKVRQLMQGAQFAQVLGKAALEAVDVVKDWVDEPREAATVGEGTSQEEPYHAAKELIRVDADHRNAKRALDSNGKLGPDYYEREQDIQALAAKLHQRGLQTRDRIGRYKATKDELRRLDQQGFAPERFSTKQDLEFKAQALRSDIAKDGAQSMRDRARLDELRKSQDRALAELPSPPSHKDLAIMLPSLTSFSASFFAHSVKIGMSPASFWRMQFKVLAIVSADLIDYGLGLVGDALLVDGPSSRVGSWVAEVACGALSGGLASSMRAFGTDAPLDFSVPIKTGSLLAGGIVQGRAEFYWGKPNSNAQDAQMLASRVGMDAPGQDMDEVTVFKSSTAPGIELPIPPVW